MVFSLALPTWCGAGGRHITRSELGAPDERIREALESIALEFPSGWLLARRDWPADVVSSPFGLGRYAPQSVGSLREPRFELPPPGS